MEESTFLNPQKLVAEAGIEEGMVVADFGAGSGFFTRAAARAVGTGGRVWAVDINRDILSRIVNLAEAEGLHNVEVLHGDIEHEGGSKLPPASVDCVIVANVLFSAEHKHVLVQEVARVLKNGGIAVVVDWSDSFGGLGPHPDHVFTRGAGVDLFEKEGCVFVHNIAAGAYHWGFIARKQKR